MQQDINKIINSNTYRQHNKSNITPLQAYTMLTVAFIFTLWTLYALHTLFMTFLLYY